MNISPEEMTAMIVGNPALAKRNPSLLSDIAKGRRKQDQKDDGGKAKKDEPDKQKSGKNSKYRNKKVYEYEDGYEALFPSIQGHGDIRYVFDSIKEYERWKELLLLQQAGKISGLSRQKELLIQEAFKYREENINAIFYKADFMYIQDGQTVIEDVKGFDKETQQYVTTKDFKLKWKLLKHRYPEYEFRLF